MPQFRIRKVLPEKMDQPGVPEHEIIQALKELEVINNLLGGYSVTLKALNQLLITCNKITIMDFGSGGGDVLRKISTWSRKKNLKVNLIGIDRNPVMTKYSKEMSIDYPEIEFKTLSVWDEEVGVLKPDIVVNSLFCHHFERTELIALVKRMYEISKQAVVINDIHRHWLAYYSIKFITGLISKTFLVRYDAPISVLNSLTRMEWVQILTEAQIPDFKIKWKWAWRWQIILKK